MLIITGSILIPLIGIGGAAFLFLLSRMERMESDISTLHNRVARLEGYIAQAIDADVTAPAETSTRPRLTFSGSSRFKGE